MFVEPILERIQLNIYPSNIIKGILYGFIISTIPVMLMVFIGMLYVRQHDDTEKTTAKDKIEQKATF